MEDNLLVLCADKMVHYVGRRGVAPGIAEPLGADKTFDYRRWRVDAAVARAVSIAKVPYRSRA